MNAAVLDRVGFTVDDLRLRGALVAGDEAGGDGAPYALLPPQLARDLGLPEELRVTDALCALGAPLLSRLVSERRGAALHSSARLDLQRVPPPRPAHAAALAERMVVRNGVVEVLDCLAGEGVYVSLHLAYVAEADDRHEGLLQLVCHAGDGGEPDAALGALLDPGRSLRSLVATPEAGTPAEVEGALRWLGARAGQRVREALRPVQDGAARRYQRDQRRIVDYFADLTREAQSPRRRTDPAAIAAKVAQLQGERDAKLAALPARYGLRVRLTPVSLLHVRVPVVRVRLRARRRKLERELATRLPAGAHALDRLGCEGCQGSTARPALCDDQVHVLCERCQPSATGRPRCPACRGR